MCEHFSIDVDMHSALRLDLVPSFAAFRIATATAAAGVERDGEGPDEPLASETVRGLLYPFYKLPDSFPAAVTRTSNRHRLSWNRSDDANPSRLAASPDGNAGLKAGDWTGAPLMFSSDAAADSVPMRRLQRPTHLLGLYAPETIAQHYQSESAGRTSGRRDWDREMAASSKDARRASKSNRSVSSGGTFGGSEFAASFRKRGYFRADAPARSPAADEDGEVEGEGGPDRAGTLWEERRDSDDAVAEIASERTHIITYLS